MVPETDSIVSVEVSTSITEGVAGEVVEEDVAMMVLVAGRASTT